MSCYGDTVHLNPFTASSTGALLTYDTEHRHLVGACGIRMHVAAPQREPELKVRSEVFMAVTVKNAVFWDIRPHFVPHRIHITSPLQKPAG
jgi:hypothetical protein